MTASARILVRLVTLVLVLGPAAAAAQDGASRLTGRVTDASGAALPGVTVTLSSTKHPATFTAITDGTGQYTFPALPPDTYTARFDLAGFEPRTESSVELGSGAIVILDRQMDLASLAETGMGLIGISCTFSFSSIPGRANTATRASRLISSGARQVESFSYWSAPISR